MLFEGEASDQASADCVNKTVLNKLERRLGGFHAKQRLKLSGNIKRDYKLFGA